ncbi:hypothetical protein TRICI_005471 [Trichomonascus ciferrii]|uniref:Uncharacterized protein n=1 Tax=Trichomonascus ciferrii TaxID=44093 RepID=A0A642USM7_9ASCO|nr:hypothetical protein TRICI_005471 [Trichomonascus ciferrii]
MKLNAVLEKCDEWIRSCYLDERTESGGSEPQLLGVVLDENMNFSNMLDLHPLILDPPTLKDGLQRVQNNALRLILGGFEKNSYRIISEGCGVGSAIQQSEELIGALDHHPNPKNPTSKSTGRLRSGTPIGNFFVQNRQKMGIARLIIGVAKLRRTQKRQKSWPPAMQIPKPIGGKPVLETLSNPLRGIFWKSSRHLSITHPNANTTWIRWKLLPKVVCSQQRYNCPCGELEDTSHILVINTRMSDKT